MITESMLESKCVVIFSPRYCLISIQDCNSYWFIVLSENSFCYCLYCVTIICLIYDVFLWLASIASWHQFQCNHGYRNMLWSHWCNHKNTQTYETILTNFSEQLGQIHLGLNHKRFTMLTTSFTECLSFTLVLRYFMFEVLWLHYRIPWA